MCFKVSPRPPPHLSRHRIGLPNFVPLVTFPHITAPYGVSQSCSPSNPHLSWDLHGFSLLLSHSFFSWWMDWSRWWFGWFFFAVDGLGGLIWIFRCGFFGFRYCGVSGFFLWIRFCGGWDLILGEGFDLLGHFFGCCENVRKFGFYVWRRWRKPKLVKCMVVVV